jgi:hypothetical protein
MPVITFMQAIYNYIPKQTMILRYTVLQLFCVDSLCYMSCYFARAIFIIIVIIIQYTGSCIIYRISVCSFSALGSTLLLIVSP